MQKIAIISDFSKTLTDGSNPTTWSVFAKSGLLGDKYTKERDDLFNTYHKFELEGNIEKTKDWWREHINLFVKFGLDIDLIKSIIKDEKYFKPRLGLKLFFDIIFGKDIDMMIVTSSGISNFVREFLYYKGIFSDKIHIKGNTLEIDNDGNVVGYEDDIITSLNKGEYTTDLSYYEKIILLGDDKSDLDMYNGDNVTKIGFCSEEKVKGYDIYLGKEGNLEEVLKYIK